jgi:hypothetical protein
MKINSKVWSIPFPCAYVVCAKFFILLMMRCWKRSPLGKPRYSHRCTRSLNAVCKCKMCTSTFSMDGQRWFRCQWWSVDSPLHPHRHRCRWSTWDRLHPLLWTSIWRHHRRLHPLQRQLLVVLHLHRRPWSSGPLLPVVVSLHALLMPRAAASSSPAITQMGWPHLPPPIGGPNGPRSGRHVGRLGGGGGERRGKPRRGRALRSTADALRIRAGARRDTRLAGQAHTPWRSARELTPARARAWRLARKKDGQACAPTRPSAVGRGGMGPTLRARSPRSGGAGPGVGTARPGRRGQSCPGAGAVARPGRGRLATLDVARHGARLGSYPARAREMALARARTRRSTRARGSHRPGHNLGMGTSSEAAVASFVLPGGGQESPGGGSGYRGG